MTKIRFKFQGKERIHEFFFGIKPGINGFSIKDDRGITHDCLLDSGIVHFYGQDSDKLEEKSQVIEF